MMFVLCHNPSLCGSHALNFTADVDDHDSEDRDVVSPPHWEGYIHEVR